MYRTKLCICVVIIGCHAVPAFAINFNSLSIKGLAQAYGYVSAQNFTLSRIAKEFPELAGEVMLAQTTFDAAFPNMEEKLQIQLKLAVGEKQVQEIKARMQPNFKLASGGQGLTREVSKNFFEQVKRRAKGDVESPVFEYLLAVKYSTNPVGEYLDKFRQRYETDGSGKSQGIRVNMQLPRSWLGEDGKRPHIVQKWGSENGTGMENILLDIRDAGGYKPTKQDIDSFVSSGEVKDIVPEGSTYISSGNFTLEKQRGYWVKFSMLQERAGFKVYQEGVINQFFFRGKAIGIMCQASGSDDQASKIRENFRRMEPLCQQVLNSLVLPQAY